MTAVLGPPAPAGQQESAEPEDGTGEHGRALLGLVVTPVLLAAVAGLLALYIGAADKDFQERTALDWTSNLSPQTLDHLWLAVRSTLLVLAIAMPLGIVLTRPLFRRISGAVLAVASAGQAVPAYGLFVIFYMWLGRGQATSVYALTLFTILPVLRNTMVGIDQVDRSTIEAARGMGLGRLLVLRRIELPLAVPVILAGVRTALVINVGMASLAFLIGGGGLGVTIFSGIQNGRDLVVFVGAAATALLALAVDWVASVFERLLEPRGL